MLDSCLRRARARACVPARMCACVCACVLAFVCKQCLPVCVRVCACVCLTATGGAGLPGSDGSRRKLRVGSVALHQPISTTDARTVRHTAGRAAPPVRRHLCARNASSAAPHARIPDPPRDSASWTSHAAWLGRVGGIIMAYSAPITLYDSASLGIQPLVDDVPGAPSFRQAARVDPR